MLVKLELMNVPEGTFWLVEDRFCSPPEVVTYEYFQVTHGSLWGCP
jgi:hypothetical protein